CDKLTLMKTSQGTDTFSAALPATGRACEATTQPAPAEKVSVPFPASDLPAKSRQHHTNSSAPTRHLDPWALVWGQPYIDANRLALAIDTDLQANRTPDFRTKVLVRDAARALN